MRIHEPECFHVEYTALTNNRKKRLSDKDLAALCEKHGVTYDVDSSKFRTVIPHKCTCKNVASPGYCTHCDVYLSFYKVCPLCGSEVAR